MNYEPTHLDLFSGIGGFSIAFEPEGFRTVGFSEVDPAASHILKHWWPDVPNFGDIRNIDRGILTKIGPIDVITGGCPCQPASALGQMRGTSDERWLWPEFLRVVGEIRPRVVVAENPPSILRLEDGRAWNGIVSKLAALGYDCMWEIVPAAAIGAGHIRERVFLIAMDSTDRVNNGERTRGTKEPEAVGIDAQSEVASNSNSFGSETREHNHAGLRQVAQGSREIESASNGDSSGWGRQGRSTGDSSEPPEQALRFGCPECGRECHQDHNSFWCDRCRGLWPKGHGWEVTSNAQSKQMGTAGQPREHGYVDASNGPSLSEREPSDQAHAISGIRDSRSEPQRNDSLPTAADSDSPRLQGHARDGSGIEGRPSTRRPIATPDLRGRISCENWWHENVTGIPVLVHGISNRLDEASCRVTGNAVVPAVAQVFARAIKQFVDAEMNFEQGLT